VINILLKSELQRFYFFNKKFLILFSLLLFTINFLIAYFYKIKYSMIEKILPTFPSFSSYPILFLSEIQAVFLNFMFIIFTANFFYKELDSGFLKFLFLRPISKIQFFITKLIIFYFFLIYVYFVFFISSYVSGFLLLENVEKITFFSSDIEIGYMQWFRNTVIFYILSLITMVPFSLCLIIINYYIKNSFYSIMLTLFFLFLNIIYPFIKNKILYNFGYRNKEDFKMFDYFSLTQFQLSGIVEFINGKNIFYMSIFSVLLLIAFFISSKLYIKMYNKL
jgi:ABC-type transport system involved in multi-copper enzyme maturation permease subunit